MNIEIDYQDYCESYEAEEQYGDWSITHNVSILGLKKCSYENITTNFDILKDKDYFIVSALYSTGDSFGSECGIPFWVQLFEAEDEAKSLAKYIEYYNEFKGLKYSNYSSLTPVKKKHRIKELTLILTEALDTFDEIDESNESEPAYTSYIKYKGVTYHFPWNGYFDVLEVVEVTTVRLS